MKFISRGLPGRCVFVFRGDGINRVKHFHLDFSTGKIVPLEIFNFVPICKNCSSGLWAGGEGKIWSSSVTICFFSDQKQKNVVPICRNCSSGLWAGGRSLMVNGDESSRKRGAGAQRSRPEGEHSGNLKFFLFLIICIGCPGTHGLATSMTWRWWLGYVKVEGLSLPQPKFAYK